MSENHTSSVQTISQQMKHENVQGEAITDSSTQISTSSEPRLSTSQQLEHVPDSSKETVGVVAQAKEDQLISLDHTESTAMFPNAEFLKCEEVLLVGSRENNKANKVTRCQTEENMKESESEGGIAGHPSTSANSLKRQSRGKKHRDSEVHEAKVDLPNDDLNEENGGFKRKRQPLQEIATVGSETSVETPEKKQKSFDEEPEKEASVAISPTLDDKKGTENAPSSSQHSSSQEIKAL